MRLIWRFLKEARRILYYRILGLQTRGVRVIILESNKVFLVKHPYDDYYVFPGGGIKKREDIFEAAIREVREETGFELRGELKKLGTYKNNERGKKDTVSIIVCNDWEKSSSKMGAIDKIEIQKSDWFDLDNLPYVSKATARRLLELKNNQYSDQIRIW